MILQRRYDKVSAIHGTMGVLLYDSTEDKVQCHICGAWFRGLNNHVYRTHGWYADEYREKFGLNRKQGLISKGTEEKLRKLNKELGNWEYLPYQTMTRAELTNFLRKISANPNYSLRKQALLLKSKLLREHNPMNTKTIRERCTAGLRRTWYGTQRHQEITKANHAVMIAKIRQKNLHDRRYRCHHCGDLFPIREEFQTHKKLVHPET